MSHTTVCILSFCLSFVKRKKEEKKKRWYNNTKLLFTWRTDPDSELGKIQITAKSDVSAGLIPAPSLDRKPEPEGGRSYALFPVSGEKLICVSGWSVQKWILINVFLRWPVYAALIWNLLQFTVAFHCLLLPAVFVFTVIHQSRASRSSPPATRLVQTNVKRKKVKHPVHPDVSSSAGIRETSAG